MVVRFVLVFVACFLLGLVVLAATTLGYDVVTVACLLLVSIGVAIFDVVRNKERAVV